MSRLSLPDLPDPNSAAVTADVAMKLRDAGLRRDERRIIAKALREDAAEMKRAAEEQPNIVYCPDDLLAKADIAGLYADEIDPDVKGE